MRLLLQSIWGLTFHLQLDRLRIRIEARDEAPANEQLVGGTWLLIKVKDVNDNRPTISVNFIGLSDGHTGRFCKANYIHR